MKMSHDMQRRTKIITTLGPSTDDPSVLAALIAAGVNAVRLNFSHGTHEEHAGRIAAVRAEAEKQSRVVGILGDLQGPKIRVASFKEGKVVLASGDRFVLDADHDPQRGDQNVVGIDYPDLPGDVRPGDILLLDDGRLRFRVENVTGSKVTCCVELGGVLSNHKGINRLGGGLTARALTRKDKEDLAFAVAQNVDYLAVSFPRDAEDLEIARALVKAAGGEVGIIAKIERAEAVAAMDEVVDASDGVMVARGDLAVEIGDAEVPLIQKQIIHRCRAKDKPVIVATQMMESMVESVVPTRAEVSDVAHAVLQNTDAIMLSAESAVGKDPVRVVDSMHRICLAAEKEPESYLSRHRVECRFRRVDEAIAMAAMYTANHLDVKGVIALTESGMTPLWMSRIRTAMPIYGLSRNKKTLGKMTLYRGVYPISFDVTQSSLDAVNVDAIEVIRSRGVFEIGDLVILTKGDHLGVGGGSNAMKILRVGEIL